MTLGNLVVNLTANTSKFTTGMQKSQSVVSSFARSAQRWLSGVAATVAATAAAWVSYSTAVKAVQAATEQLASERKLAAVLKATGSDILPETIKNFASLRQSVTNFGDETTINAAAVLATFKGIRTEAFLPTLQVAQDMSAVLGTDLQSSVLQLGKALENPAVGLTYLRRSGVSFTDSQVAMIKKLAESGRMLEAQQIILREVQSQFGGAAVATADFFTQLGNYGGDILEGIGELIIGIGEAINRELDVTGFVKGLAEWTLGLAQNKRLVSDISDILTEMVRITSRLVELSQFQFAGPGSGLDGLLNWAERFLAVLNGIEGALGQLSQERSLLPPPPNQREPRHLLPNAASVPPGLAPPAPGARDGAANILPKTDTGDWLENMIRADAPGNRNIAPLMQQLNGTGPEFAKNLTKPLQQSVSRDFAPAAEKGSVEAYRMIIRAQKPDEQIKLLNAIEGNTRKPAVVNAGPVSKTIDSFK